MIQCMQPPEIFATERLLLRRPRLSDARAILEEYAQDPLVTRFLAWRPHQSIADTIAFLETTEQHWKSGRRFSWALTRQGRIM